MAQTYYVMRQPDGEIITVSSKAGHGDCEEIGTTTKIPGPYDTWVPGTGWVTDIEAEADGEVGPSHIAEMHALKAAEAAMIASGVELTHGILVEEAAATGQPLAELAEQVLEHEKAAREREVARRVAKVEART